MVLTKKIKVPGTLLRPHIDLLSQQPAHTHTSFWTVEKVGLQGRESYSTVILVLVKGPQGGSTGGWAIPKMGWEGKGGLTWGSELLAEVAVSGFSPYLAPALRPWFGHWFLGEELKIIILRIWVTISYIMVSHKRISKQNKPEFQIRSQHLYPT